MLYHSQTLFESVTLSLTVLASRMPGVLPCSASEARLAGSALLLQRPLLTHTSSTACCSCAQIGCSVSFETMFQLFRRRKKVMPCSTVSVSPATPFDAVQGHFRNRHQPKVYVRCSLPFPPSPFPAFLPPILVTPLSLPLPFPLLPHQCCR